VARAAAELVADGCPPERVVICKAQRNHAGSNFWSPLANVPAIVSLQNAVTNTVSVGAQLYQLKKWFFAPPRLCVEN